MSKTFLTVRIEASNLGNTSHPYVRFMDVENFWIIKKLVATHRHAVGLNIPQRASVHVGRPVAIFGTVRFPPAPRIPQYPLFLCGKANDPRDGHRKSRVLQGALFHTAKFE